MSEENETGQVGQFMPKKISGHDWSLKFEKCNRFWPQYSLFALNIYTLLLPIEKDLPYWYLTYFPISDRK